MISVKGQIINISAFVGHMFVSIIQHCHCINMKAATGNVSMNGGCLFQWTLFMDTEFWTLM